MTEKLAGFMMVMLRRIRRRTDVVALGGFHFEVMKVDSDKIDQVMVTRDAALALQAAQSHIEADKSST